MKKSPAKATNALRRKELANLRRERKAAAAAVLRELTTLRKRADKIVAEHRQHDAVLARRAAIVESRLS